MSRSSRTNEPSFLPEKSIFTVQKCHFSLSKVPFFRQKHCIFAYFGYKKGSFSDIFGLFYHTFCLKMAVFGAKTCSRV